jgi:hypothetical protein
MVRGEKEESEKRGEVRPRPQYNFSGADYVRPGPLSYPPYYARGHF